MGCSSSSAQTVEQEKRPGTKPEESNGDTVAVRNGIFTDDVATIEDQMQLPVQTTLPGDLKVGAEDETEAVLVAMEAQEDLGSGEDLLTVPEPQSEAPASKEQTPQLASSAAVEDSAELQVAVTLTEAGPPVEEALPVETVAQAALPEVKTLEGTEETPEAKSVEAVDSEVPVSAEEVVTVPAAEPVVEAPAGTVEAVDKAVNESDSTAPTEDAELVQAEAPTGNAAPETLSETPGLGEASAASTVSVANEEAAAAEPSRPADAVEPVIDITLAAASIPEIPPLTPVTTAAQVDPSSANKEEMEVSTASAVAASPAEVTSPVEVITPPGPAETSEAPPVRANLEPSTETGVTAEVPEVDADTTQTQAPPDPESATETVPEPSTQGESVNEDTEGEIAKKQD